MSENENPGIDFKDEEQKNWFILAITVLIMLALFIIKFKFRKVKEEFKLTPKEAKRRHDRLTKHIEKKQGLKKALDKKYRSHYLFVRIALVVCWFLLLTVLFLFGLIEDLGDALNYSELFILIFILFNFLAFGSLRNLDFFLEVIQTKIKNLVYDKYQDLEIQIDEHKKEQAELEEIIADNQTDIDILLNNK